MALPTLNAAWLENPALRPGFLRALREACVRHGFFYLLQDDIPAALCESVLRQSARFFDLPADEKNRVHIRRSSHFRGYSEMKNARDWREQMHFSWEKTAPLEIEPPCLQLAGPNLWPGALEPQFGSDIKAFMEGAAHLGRRLLAAIAETLDLEPDYFERLSTEQPYQLLKLICYYPQSEQSERPGVAAHCDWSWLTILLEDETGGLELLDADGHWQAVIPKPGILSVNLGELLEILTNGLYRAAPHRVFNPSRQKKRFSAPVFINPALDARITPLELASAQARAQEQEHVHRVVAQGTPCAPFLFGDSEWRRKGLGQWCYDAHCLK